MTRLHDRSRWWPAVEAMSAVVLVVLLLRTTSVLAGDSSYRQIVKQLRSEYRATEQSLYGAGVLGGLTVAFIRPAGVSSVKFAILKDLDSRRSQSRDFNRVVRSAVESKWRPMVVHSSPGRGEWTHIFAQPDGKHIKLLIVTRARTDAFVAEVRIDPDRLSAFIENPQILGIRIGDRETPLSTQRTQRTQR